MRFTLLSVIHLFKCTQVLYIKHTVFCPLLNQISSRQQHMGHIFLPMLIIREVCSAFVRVILSASAPSASQTHFFKAHRREFIKLRWQCLLWTQLTVPQLERGRGRVRSSTLQYISCHLLPPPAGRMRDGCVGVSPPFRAACVLFSERPGKVSAVKLSLLNTEEPHVRL